MLRHAFGNVRNILKEVSYSLLMGEFLTFSGSESLASSGTLPDENYAREVMQLFSIGLLMLNDDGSYVLNARGEPIPAYNVDDIEDFAKC